MGRGVTLDSNPPISILGKILDFLQEISGARSELCIIHSVCLETNNLHFHTWSEEFQWVWLKSHILPTLKDREKHYYYHN